MAAKQELLHFLDRSVFNPILSASPGSFGETDRKTLLDVQKRTRSEQDRFRHYGSAGELIENYKRDLTSPAAKRVNKKLEKLHLPTLPSVKERFLKIAGAEVRGSRGTAARRITS